MKTILVCGAGGFIGNHLVDSLKSQGHYIVGADLKVPPYNETKADKFYIGATENIEQRLAKHRNKNKGFTNQADDWQIVYSEEFQTKTEALAYERLIKSWKSKKKIISHIESK